MTNINSLPVRVNRSCDSRNGNVAIMTAFCMPIVIAFVAFAIDWGLMAVARSELQNAADSAALAGCAQILDDRALLYLYTPWEADEVDLSFYDSARREAAKFALENDVRGVGTRLDTAVDVDIFHVDPDTKEVSHDNPAKFNTVRVTTRRSAALNGTLPLFVSGFFGLSHVTLKAVAQATFYDGVGKIGRPPKDGKNSILPFAVKKSDWDKVVSAQQNPNIDLDGDGKPDIQDKMVYDPDGEGADVDLGEDGIPEMRMYPDAPGKGGNLTPGNFGTVNVGASNNSASHIANQVTNGMSQADWDYQGAPFDFSKPFNLTGDTGLSVGFKDEMSAIVGQTRTIFLYEEVEGSGDNATFKIVGAAGVRVMASYLTGGQKAIYVQPAPVTDAGGMGGGDPRYNVTSPVTLTE